MKYMIFLIVIGLMNGCSYEEGPTLPDGSQLKAYIEPQAEPNHYTVRLRWQIPEAGPSWVVHREVDGKSPVHLSTLEAKAMEYTDNEVIPGKKYRYILGAMTDGSYLNVAAVTAVVPKDMEVKERLVISQVTGMGRLFLSSSARLVTEGKDSVISVDEIISENGVIESFSDAAQAPVGEVGRDGGSLTIKAKRGRGSLIVNARGEAGGKGAAGVSGVSGKKGKQGRLAIGTHERVNVVCNCGHRAHELREGMKNGNIFSHMQFLMERTRHRCINEPTDGTQGEPGTAGTPGSHGGKGGNSARVYVELEDSSQLKVDVFIIPGNGGAGGTGGVGGKGGPGGDAGSTSLDFFSNCRNPAAGPAGQNGVDGKPGLPGLNGSHEPFCLNLGGQKSPDCHKF